MVTHSPGIVRLCDVSTRRALMPNLLLNPALSFAHIFVVTQVIPMPSFVTSCHNGLISFHILHKNVADLCFIQVENSNIYC